MNTRLTLALGASLSVALVSTMSSAFAEDIEASGGSYISVGGSVLKTGLGDCTRTGSFSDSDIINACEGIEDEAADAAADAGDSSESDSDAVTTQVAETPKAPAAQATAKVDTKEFSETTLFDTGSSSLSSSGQAVMNSLFGALAEYKGITGISVTGHTDSRGSEEFNQALSEARAQAVAAEISARYPGAKMSVQGMGESSPVASNDTAEGRQLNRRVDIEVTATRMTFN